MESPGDWVPATEQEAREWADYFVISIGQRAKTLHLPDADYPRDSPRPLCGLPSRKKGTEFRAKETTIFPPGYRPICFNCRERLTKIL